MRPFLLSSLGVVGIVAPFTQASAQLRATPSVSVNAGAGYSSNPYLTPGDTQGSGTANLDVSPVLDLIDGLDRATIAGNYNRTDYFSRYPSNDGYGVTVNGSHQINARTSFGVNVGFNSAVLGSANAFPASPFITVPGSTTGVDSAGKPITTPIPPTVIPNPALVGSDGDLGLFGLLQRRNMLSGGANFNYQPSDRSTWSFGIDASRTDYPGQAIGLSSYRSYGANAAYTRTLSARESVGATLSVSVVDYQFGQTSKIYTPRLTYTRQLATNWSLNLAVGTAIVDDGRSKATVSANGSLCKSGERSNLCLTASRDPSISGFSGVRTTTSANLSYSYQLAETTSLSVSGAINHIDQGFTANPVNQTFLNQGSQDYFSANVGLNRSIGRHLGVNGSVSYRDVNGLGVPVDADIGGRIGLSWTIGGR